jgi:hypothetical protein
MLHVINGEHVNSTKRFKSIEVDPGAPGAPLQVHYRNPFPEAYEQVSTRSELIGTWKKECRLREQELEEFFNEYTSRLKC